MKEHPPVLAQMLIFAICEQAVYLARIYASTFSFLAGLAWNIHIYVCVTLMINRKKKRGPNWLRFGEYLTIGN